MSDGVPSDGAAFGTALVTGGAGFVGTNLVAELLRRGVEVRLLDDLSRPGVEQNLAWLQRLPGRLVAYRAPLADRTALAAAMRGVDTVFHLAAQVAVTSSVDDPTLDFDTNVRGTLAVLETARQQRRAPAIVFTSTNKVYGDLGGLCLERSDRRYEPADERVRASGIGERTPLDFHTPYGCSKGAADQYVLDYARTYGLETVVFRMSCIYGPHQFGTEDQGWLAHFVLRALAGLPITIFGDGMQVRDVLYVEDLVLALLRAAERASALAGRAFNVGGGPERSVSLLELLELIAELHGRSPDVAFEAWRPGDQRYYVSDVSSLRSAIGWEPRTTVRDGVSALYRWLAERQQRRVPPVAERAAALRP